MQIQTLYRQHDSIYGVIAVRAQLIAENTITVHDTVQRQFPNDLDALAEHGYYPDPVQARNHKE
jgi:hypothetical protein